MALPSDLPTSTVTFGPYPDGVGTTSLKGLKGKIRPVHPTTFRPLNLVHVATGAAIVPVPVPIVLADDSTGSVGPLPRQGSGLLSPDNFLWSVEWDTSSNSPSPGNKVFALPLDSAATVDFDNLGVAATAPAVYVPIGTGPQGPPGPAGPAGSSTPTGGAGGALSGTYPNPGLNESAVISIIQGAITDGEIAAGVDLSGVPTLEELDRVISLGAVNAAAVRRLGPASFDQRIGGLSIAVGATVAASDTDYWSVSLLRLRSGTNPLTVTTRTTKTTGGAAFTADQGWNFDAMQWLETARHLRKGDVLALSFTKTGAPADLTDVSVSIRYEPGIVPLIRDTFTRTDSTSSLGATDTGQAYEAPLAGTLGIAGGQGYAAVLDGGAAYVLLDAGRSDYTASIKITESGQALVFRATDYDNLFEIGAGGVSKFQAGAYSSLIANPGGVAANDVLSVAVSGPSISAYKNGVLLGTISDAFNQTATRIGLGTVNTTGRFDDLELAA